MTLTLELIKFNDQKVFDYIDFIRCFSVKDGCFEIFANHCDLVSVIYKANIFINNRFVEEIFPHSGVIIVKNNLIKIIIF